MKWPLLSHCPFALLFPLVDAHIDHNTATKMKINKDMSRVCLLCLGACPLPLVTATPTGPPDSSSIHPLAVNSSIQASTVDDEFHGPTCWGVRDLPEGFHCQQAVDQFLATLTEGRSYWVQKAIPMGFPCIRLPKTFRAGICTLNLDMTSQVPVFQTNKAELRNWLQILLNKCVVNERRSGGGTFWYTFEDTRGSSVNDFIMSVSPDISDGNGGGVQLGVVAEGGIGIGNGTLQDLSSGGVF